MGHLAGFGLVVPYIVLYGEQEQLEAVRHGELCGRNDPERADELRADR
jgi:hypothetical protein